MAAKSKRPHFKFSAAILSAGFAVLSLTACADGPNTPSNSATVTTTTTMTDPAMGTAPGDQMALTGTVVSRQIQQLRSDLVRLQSDVSAHGSELSALRGQTEQNSQAYFMAVAEINARLQTGTTPGNPRLVDKWRNASNLLEGFGGNITSMNGLASKIAASASMAAYLLESTRATYSLSGAVEEDHVQLANVEDDVNRTVVQIDRVLMDLNNDIERQTSYLTNERSNLQMLSLAIAKGELYGPSFSNRPFAPAPAPAMAVQPMDLTNLPHTSSSVRGKKGKSYYVAPANSPTVQKLRAAAGIGQPVPSTMPMPPAMPMTGTAATKPFVIVRFDRADIDYGQPLYQAMDQAMNKNPNATFEIVAVSPANSNPAQKILSANEARRHAEDVMRTLKQMGMPAERMTLTAAENNNAKTPEVHIFLR